MIRNQREAGLDFRRPRRLNNLGLRIISGIILGSIVLGITYYGGIAFHLMIAFFACALLYEWLEMAGNRVQQRSRIVLWLLLAVALIPLILNMDASIVVPVALAAMVLGVAHEARQSGRNGIWVSGGIVYALLAAVSVDQIREGAAAGLAAMVFLFTVVWTTDSLAYVFGRLIGGRKLAPSISPSKTWSGALGGALAAVIVGAAVGRLMGIEAGFLLAVAALVLSVVSQIGDLLESAVKRRFGVKDSGRLIPGHGGVMDRVDGLVAAALALYLISLLTGGLHEPSRGLFFVF
ncbi:phosphatidate cytidylyltransferase [Tianweitania sp. BSSL-BM11]|uniref:Phosphatidate cytidylyltransferase n=1 Tax=Tianweitania aestuarii TaxID=2814886 RepID=A0ABS5RTY8_9HYPH|nr:phosphatidate cytidylyltransferase [Tianweitania aestuarii]MBS9720508.1 phosphatidate cytidylyltransferase [Tianweitania aestuarii]